MNTLAFGLPGNYEWLIILVVGLLIFGRRLPEVGRSLGRSIVEFKRGVKGIQDEIDSESKKPAAQIEPPKDAAGKDARFGHGDHVEVTDRPATSES